MGVATGIAIAAGISAAASAYSAHKQSQAAEEAANSETAASDKALAIQKSMYDQNRADNDPYLSAGRVALGRLGDLSSKPRMVFDPNNPASLMGPPKPTTMGRAQAASAGNSPAAGFQPQQGPSGFQSAGTPGAPQATFQPMASLGQPGGSPQGPPPIGAPGGAGGSQGALWTVQSPDGSDTRQLPQPIAEQFIARGAKRVG